jgi:hypothetical protein
MNIVGVAGSWGSGSKFIVASINFTAEGDLYQNFELLQRFFHDVADAGSCVMTKFG